MRDFLQGLVLEKGEYFAHVDPRIEIVIDNARTHQLRIPVCRPLRKQITCRWESNPCRFSSAPLAANSLEKMASTPSNKKSTKCIKRPQRSPSITTDSSQELKQCLQAVQEMQLNKTMKSSPTTAATTTTATTTSSRKGQRANRRSKEPPKLPTRTFSNGAVKPYSMQQRHALTPPTSPTLRSYGATTAA